MSVKSKIVGVLRSVYGIFVDAGSLIFKSAGSIIFQNSNGSQTFSVGNAGTLGHTNYSVQTNGGTAIEGAATSVVRRLNKVTGIADNVATSVYRITVPNANHAGTIRVVAVGSSGGADAFESTAALEGNIVVARTTGANAVATAATATLTGTSTVAAGAALTSFAYGVSAVSGAAGASNTFDITVTINDSGGLGSNQCLMYIEVFNAESGGLTTAAL
jgi:hypothetical protein